MLIFVCSFVRVKLVQSSQSSSFWLKFSSNQSGISQQSVSTQRALREHLESTQRALGEISERYQRAIRENSEHQNKSQYSRSLKYCVLFQNWYILKRNPDRKYKFKNCLKVCLGWLDLQVLKLQETLVWVAHASAGWAEIPISQHLEIRFYQGSWSRPGRLHNILERSETLGTFRNLPAIP